MRMKAIKRVTQREVAGPDGLAARWQEFDAGNVKGIAGAAGDTGELAGGALIQYLRDAQEGRVIYTVISYRTPIAWVRDDGRVFKSQAFYSAATTRHQNLLTFLGDPEE